MKDLKDYVFYILLKNDDMTNDKGNSYGVKRNFSKDHDSYFQSFISIDPFLLQDVEISYDWNTTLSNLAQNGNVIVANTAVEIDELEHRFYIIYLPSNPNLYQLNNLEMAFSEFEQFHFDVGVFGENQDEFLKIRMNNNFNSYIFLKNYVEYHKYNLENKKVKKKVMSR